MSNSETHTNETLSETTLRLVTAIVDMLRDKRGALLPILHAIQEELGYIPEAAVPIVADRLNLTRAEVHGVVSFYHDFRSKKTGRRIVKVCQAESCQALGSAGLTAAAKQILDIDFEETTDDGAFTLRKAFCLGNCARSPSVMIDAEIHGRVTPDALETILEGARVHL
jgi:formate dehydrogenase subunit gamma